jgi:hypothetical protein
VYGYGRPTLRPGKRETLFYGVQIWGLLVCSYGIFF